MTERYHERYSFMDIQPLTAEELEQMSAQGSGGWGKNSPAFKDKDLDRQICLERKVKYDNDLRAIKDNKRKWNSQKPKDTQKK